MRRRLGGESSRRSGLVLGETLYCSWHYVEEAIQHLVGQFSDKLRTPRSTYGVVELRLKANGLRRRS